MSRKIVIVVHSLKLGGAERVAVILANHWTLENEVLVVTTETSHCDFYALNDGVRRLELGIASQSRSAIDAIVRNVRHVASLRRTLKRERPTVVVGVHSQTSALVALSSVGLPCLKIGSEHSHPPNLPLNASWKLMRALSYRFLDCVVALTDRSAVWLRKHTNAKRVRVIANPIVLPLPRTKPVLPVNSLTDQAVQPPFVLCVGRLAPEKRFDRAISSFASAAIDYPDWMLVIAGEGSERTKLEDCARRNGIMDRVRFLGRVGNLADWYEACAIFFLTSDREGFPNTLLEAMAYGAAVVTVDCETGPRELVQDGSNGRLVNQSDKAGLIRALRDLIQSEGERKRLGEAALRVRDHYSVHAIAQAWETEFSRAAQ